MNKRALEILFSTYWSPSGWKPQDARSLSDIDFGFAKSHGVMFDPIEWDHDALVDAASRLLEQTDPRAVADAFVVSLSTRRLDYRSALGSYAVLRNFPRHPRTGNQASCSTCGSYEHSSAQPVDLNILNFERHKWGGVRHLQPSYAVFDLQQFQTMPRIAAEREHILFLRELLLAFDSVPSETTAATLHHAMPASLRSNKAERDVLISILGFAGILESHDHRGFLHDFVTAERRELPNRRFVDMPYPACWWVGTEGINWEAVALWFGHLGLSRSQQ